MFAVYDCIVFRAESAAASAHAVMPAIRSATETSFAIARAILTIIGLTLENIRPGCRFLRVVSAGCALLSDGLEYVVTAVRVRFEANAGAFKFAVNVAIPVKVAQQ